MLQYVLLISFHRVKNIVVEVYMSIIIPENFDNRDYEANLTLGYSLRVFYNISLILVSS